MSQSPILREVSVGASGLPGTLALPPACGGLVIFAHGSGSSRLSPRNTHVARQLNGHGFATLLFDLLTVPEAEDRRNVFDIPLLGTRVAEALQWVAREEDLSALPIGLFGASTGAAAALVAAALAPDLVKAVVSRGGRPDLAGEALASVAAPTLLIVGGLDREVLDLNRAAQRRMQCPTSLVVVPGATHLFEEPGTLDAVVSAAVGWFAKHLAGA
ncbi:pimeloyl-ACP methyl ester carboxylesterase [Microvirga flocculans]|uniref:Pimeloyl-ACP methyl ester carboxylesterase n=1 Tax=Microvirga flocculans TaxID=217168 RepID=A0A7W6N6N4_9HYPH|nr:alpha/beta fold hydrolase [Microvirga flocculans]MBB4038777.1 pimeloyl-ACP methyl ester carboxylesterase [Microvirga flocculans]